MHPLPTTPPEKKWEETKKLWCQFQKMVSSILEIFKYWGHFHFWRNFWSRCTHSPTLHPKRNRKGTKRIRYWTILSPFLWFLRWIFLLVDMVYTKWDQIKRCNVKKSCFPVSIFDCSFVIIFPAVSSFSSSSITGGVTDGSNSCP